MKILRAFPITISLSLLLISMGITGIARTAGMADGTASQHIVEMHLLRAQIANLTDRIIVKYRQPSVDNATISAVTLQVSQTTGHVMTHMSTTGTGALIFKLDESLPLEDVEKISDEIELNPAVEYAEPDKRFFPLFTPSDPRYNEQWHYYEPTAGAMLPVAWDTTRGEDVIIAVIDTGYTDHADLVDNLQLPGIDLINDTSVSNDGDGRDQDAHDPGDWSLSCGMFTSSWHGTHIAGTLAAVGENGIGVIGVAFNASVVPVRVLGTCGGWLSDIADGIVWAAGGHLSGVPANQTPAQVLNLSTGGYSDVCSQYTQEAIDTALQLGSTVIVAAGNSNMDASGIEPANCSGVITVAASDRNGNRPFFSNYGDVVDIAAPGVQVLSTLNTGSTTPGSDTYGYYEGTSMATPHVSGVAALLYSIKPDITPGEVEQIIKDSARPFPGTCNGCGVGLLDAEAAVAALTDPAPADLVILENGVAQSNLTGTSDDRLRFAIDLPASAENLKFIMSGGSGDADLYVQFGSEPTLSSYDCRPFLHGNNEKCRIPSPQEGRYYVLIHGYDDFSEVSLLATYDVDSDTDPDPVIKRFKNSEDYPIPDFNFTGAVSPIDVPLTGASGLVDVHVKIIHPFMREVLLKLIAPNGRQSILSFGTGGVDLKETYSLDLGNIPASGRWRIQAKDFGPFGQGYIDRWSITFKKSN